LGNLKKAFDKKMEAKKNYKQQKKNASISMRPPSDLGKAFAFFAGVS
jgi:hypothetical protein